MQGTTANRTRHSLAVTSVSTHAHQTHSHLLAVPCANSAIIFALHAPPSAPTSATTSATTPATNISHLFRSTPQKGLVTCSGVLFQPSSTQTHGEPLLAITTVSTDDRDLGTPIHIGIVKIKRNPVSPDSFLMRNVANICVPPDATVLGDREASTTMAFHPVHANSLVLCPKVMTGVCYQVTWNNIGESHCQSFVAPNSHGPITTVCFSPAGELFLTTDTNHVVRVFSVHENSGSKGDQGMHYNKYNYMHSLASYTPISGHVTSLQWYVDSNYRDHIVAGHHHGTVSVWSGAEQSRSGMQSGMDEEDREDREDREDTEDTEDREDRDRVMYGTLTEYASLHGFNNQSAVTCLHVQRDDTWMTMSSNGLTRTWTLCEKKMSKARIIEDSTSHVDATPSLLMTPIASKTSRRLRSSSATATHNTSRKTTNATNATPSTTQPTTPRTVKKRQKQTPKHVPFGRSSPTMRDSFVDKQLSRRAKVTSHRFSSNHAKKHSRSKHLLHRPPPFPLPSMRQVLENKSSQFMEEGCGTLIQGCVALGNGYAHHFVVLTELGVRVVNHNQTALTTSDVAATIAATPPPSAATGRKEEVRLMVQSTKPLKPMKAWGGKAQRVHRRYRLPPKASSGNGDNGDNGKAAARAVARGSKQDQVATRIIGLSDRISSLEIDLKEVRDSFRSFANTMQQDLNRALDVVGKLVAERPPRFVQRKPVP